MKFSALPEQLQSLLLKVTGLHSKDQDLLPSKLRQWHYSEIFWELYGKHSRNDMGQDDTAKTSTELIHLLNQYIVANRSAIFSLNIRNPILIKRPKPPLREQYASYLPEIDHIDQQFLRDPDFALNGLRLSQTIHIQAKFYFGQLLYAAIRYGELLRVDLLKSLLHQILYAAPYQCNNVVWYELVAADQSQMIWIPDPVSSTLLPRLLNMRNTSNWAEHPAVQQLNIQSCLSYFLKSFGLPHIDELLKQRKERIKKLLKIVEARLSLTHTACHLPVLAGEEPNLSLAPEAFRRLLTKATQNEPSHAFSFLSSAPGAPLVHTSKPLKPAKEPALLSAPISKSITDCDAVIKKVKQKLASSALAADPEQPGNTQSRSVRGLALDLKAIAQSTEFVLLPVTRLLIEWAAFRLTSQSKWSGKLKPSTLISHLGVILKPLTRLFAARSLIKMDSADLDEYYHEVIDDAPKQQGQMRRAAILRDFHLFLEKEYQIDPSYVCSGFVMRGSKYKALMVDANILLPAEYKSACQTLLRRIDLSVAPDENRVRLLLLILGFRCGLRRSEALYLRFDDIKTPGPSTDEISSLTELLIRPHSERQLKSKSASRRLPLGLLLSQEERGWLSAFLRLRRPDDQSKYLCADPHADKPLDIDIAFKPLVAVLQEITGDPDFRYHRLRHSFVTWTFWYWQQHKYQTSHPLTPFLSHEVMSHLVEARQQYFLQAQSTAIRGELHAVSCLAGHSSPSITLFHYLHSMQWCYTAESWRLYSLHQDTNADVLKMSRRNYFYRLKQIGLPALLAAELAPWCKKPELPEKKKSANADDIAAIAESRFHEIREFYQGLHLYNHEFPRPQDYGNRRYQNSIFGQSDEDQEEEAKADPKRWALNKKLSPEHFVSAVHLLRSRQLKILDKRQNKHLFQFDDPQNGNYQSHEASDSIELTNYVLPNWPKWHSVAAKSIYLIRAFEKLSSEQQREVYKACKHVVTKWSPSAVNCQFRQPEQLWEFVNWLAPLLRLVPDVYFLNIAIHYQSTFDAWRQTEIIARWQAPAIEGVPIRVQPTPVKDISRIPFAEVTLRHQRSKEYIREAADNGFTVAMTMLYFYFGKDFNETPLQHKGSAEPHQEDLSLPIHTIYKPLMGSEPVTTDSTVNSESFEQRPVEYAAIDTAIPPVTFEPPKEPDPNDLCNSQLKTEPEKTKRRKKKSDNYWDW